jgi:SAM-dependent methyltransferase
LIHEILAAGRVNTADEWQAYIERFHDERPSANEFFTLLETVDGSTSYELTARAVAALQPRHVLEVACGEGNLAESLLGVVDARTQYTGIDLSGSEIEMARARFERERRATFVRADASVLPFSTGSFDAVAAHQFFNFQPSPLPALREAARVLSPTGTLVMASHRGWRETPELNWRIVHRAAVGALREQYPNIQWPPLMHDDRVYTDDGIRELLAATQSFDMQSVRVEHYSVGSTLSPDRVVAIYNRLYVFAGLPDRSFVNNAIVRAIQSLANGEGKIAIDIPFRMVSVRKRR